MRVPPPGRPLLSVEETAVLLGEDRTTIYRSIKRGDFPLPVLRINGRMRIPWRAVERLLEGWRGPECSPKQDEPAIESPSRR